MSDADGYPTEDDEEYYRTVKVIDDAFFEKLEEDWWSASWGYKRARTYLYLSTGGWSGNESIISALQQNVYFWTRFEMERAGGHYKFRWGKQEKQFTS